MTSPLVQLAERIHDLQAALEAELEEKRERFRYRFERRRVVFEAEVIARDSGEQLFLWQAPKAPPGCGLYVEEGTPNCTLKGVGREARSLAWMIKSTISSSSLSPAGRLR